MIPVMVGVVASACVGQLGVPSTTTSTTTILPTEPSSTVATPDTASSEIPLLSVTRWGVATAFETTEDLRVEVVQTETDEILSFDRPLTALGTCRTLNGFTDQTSWCGFGVLGDNTGAPAGLLVFDIPFDDARPQREGIVDSRTVTWSADCEIVIEPGVALPPGIEITDKYTCEPGAAIAPPDAEVAGVLFDIDREEAVHIEIALPA